MSFAAFSDSQYIFRLPFKYVLYAMLETFPHLGSSYQSLLSTSHAPARLREKVCFLCSYLHTYI